MHAHGVGEHHDVGFPLVKDDAEERIVDKKNYDRHENLADNGLGRFFFSRSDAGLFFFVYLVSGLMLLGCYLKFVVRKRNLCFPFAYLFRQRQYSNPLLGKV